MCGWTQLVMGIGVWVDATHVFTCMTWCIFTEYLFFFISSHCSESGPVCGVSLN